MWIFNFMKENKYRKYKIFPFLRFLAEHDGTFAKTATDGR